MSQVLKVSLAALVVTVGAAAIIANHMTLGGHPSVQHPLSAMLPINLSNHAVANTASTPAPYTGETASQTGWPGAQAQGPATNQAPMPTLATQPVAPPLSNQAPPQPMADNGGQTTDDVQTPAGMDPVQSPAGHVFVADVDSGNADQAVQRMQSAMQTYFSSPVSLGRWHVDRNTGLSEVLFSASDHGQPVDGMISASVGDDGGDVYVLFDSPNSVNQTMPVMINAMRRAEASDAPANGQTTTY